MRAWDKKAYSYPVNGLEGKEVLTGAVKNKSRGEKGGEGSDKGGKGSYKKKKRKSYYLLRMEEERKKQIRRFF